MSICSYFHIHHCLLKDKKNNKKNIFPYLPTLKLKNKSETDLLFSMPNGRIYQIKIYKKMFTPNYAIYGCVGGTYKFTCSGTVFTSLVRFFFMLTIVQLLVLLIFS